jgi:hypothetical protein
MEDGGWRMEDGGWREDQNQWTRQHRRAKDMIGQDRIGQEGQYKGDLFLQVDITHATKRERERGKRRIDFPSHCFISLRQSSIGRWTVTHLEWPASSSSSSSCSSSYSIQRQFPPFARSRSGLFIPCLHSAPVFVSSHSDPTVL